MPSRSESKTALELALLYCNGAAQYASHHCLNLVGDILAIRGQIEKAVRCLSATDDRRSPEAAEWSALFMEKLGDVLREQGFGAMDVATIRAELTAAMPLPPAPVEDL